MFGDPLGSLHDRGIPAAVFLVLERIRPKPFEWRTFFFVFIVFGFFASSYQTWHDE